MYHWKAGHKSWPISLDKLLAVLTKHQTPNSGALALADAGGHLGIIGRDDNIFGVHDPDVHFHNEWLSYELFIALLSAPILIVDMIHAKADGFWKDERFGNDVRF